MKVNVPAVFGCVALLFAFAMAATRSSALMVDRAVELPAPNEVSPPAQGLQSVVFAGGCFWGVQGVFAHVKGVKSAVAGYAGGAARTARYDLVSTGTTGHAEAVRVIYDPAQVDYSTLLRMFFSVVADPTSLNYQGPDQGPQYRTAIFPTTDAQRAITRRYIEELNRSKIWSKPIVTRIEAGSFYPAEAYHQNYLTRHPDAPYIRINDLPKVTALKRLFPSYYRSQPALVS